MSGICGVVNFDGAPVDPAALERMVMAAVHRGRDGIGYWLRDNVGFANLRLNITPESVRERQPQVSVDDARVLTASARLDNRADLARLLTGNGCLQETQPTDADLILAAYQHWGRDCAAHLIGDFAFAIWDGARRALFAARDPMGFRAFYYRHTPQGLLFASEVKSILAVPGVPAKLLDSALAMHLAGAHSPLDWTFFEGVSQLPAAHTLWCDVAGLRTWRHWDVEPEARLDYRSEDDYAEHFLEMFKEAVRARLRSTQPVGIWLSGGLDSGSVASTAGWLRQQHGNNGYPRLHAYSWIFENLTQCDERYISDGIVHHYGLAAHYVSAEQYAPFKQSSTAVIHPDEPSIQVYSPLLQEALQRAREEGVGLILSGFRGDPMVESGDFDYIDLLLAGRWRLIARHLALYRKRVPSWPLRRLVWDRFVRPIGEAVLQTRALAWAAYPFSPFLEKGVATHPTNPYPSWIAADLARKVHLRDRVRRPRPSVRIKGLARRTRYRSIFFPGFFRAAVEQERHNATMGIGYADPWSDRRLVEFILSVPAYVLSRIGEEKRITRRAMRGVMPEKVRRAARKIVPSPLYDRMMRKDARDTILNLFTDSQLAARGFIAEGELRRCYHAFAENNQRPDPGLWFTISAELWLRRHWA